MDLVWSHLVYVAQERSSVAILLSPTSPSNYLLPVVFLCPMYLPTTPTLPYPTLPYPTLPYRTPTTVSSAGSALHRPRSSVAP